MKPVPFLLALSATLAGPAAAAERLLVLDPGATEVTFTLSATAHEVHGSFRLREGRLRFDPATGAAAGTIEVEARGATTGNDRRDRKMHETVLESETYPMFVFEPGRFDGRLEGDGPHEIVVHGTMTVHGQAHEMALPMKVSTAGERMTVTASFAVPYVQWGLEDPSVFILRVAKKVAVEVTAVGTTKPVP